MKEATKLAASALLAGLALAAYVNVSTTCPQALTRSEQKRPAQAEVPAALTIFLPEQVIVAQRAPRSAIPAAGQKTWQCGRFYTNLVGGRNRDCGWK